MFLFDDAEHPPEGATASLIGIGVAICGNVLISLALNCQKLAHRQLEQNAADSRTGSVSGADRRMDTVAEESSSGLSTPRSRASRAELQAAPISASYGATNGNAGGAVPKSGKFRNPLPRFFGRKPSKEPATSVDIEHGLDLPPIPTEATLLIDIRPSPTPSNSSGSSSLFSTDSLFNKGADRVEPVNETAYLKSKLWWFGFLLMNVGEFGNFLSYAFAPASVVAPLGTFALIANCVFAPFMLGEKFHRRDFLGIVLAIIGALTVVAASKTSDVRLDTEALIEALKQHTFIAYTVVTAVAAIILGVLSEGRAGRTYVAVDIGLCALFGGYTVLATKAISTLLSLEWIQVFQEWITYPTLVVLLVTGIGQIKYLNRALMKFDSKAVIPIQFVFFNLAAILGSAILYRDFEDLSLHQFITFLYGCATTFLGVFFLTSPQAAVTSEIETVLDIQSPPEDRDTANTRVQLTPGPMGARGPRGHVRGHLRGRASSVSLGLSAGQYLLLATQSADQESSEAVRSPREDRRRTIHFTEGINNGSANGFQPGVSSS